MLKCNGCDVDSITFNNKQVKILEVNGLTIWVKNTTPEQWELNSDLRNTIGPEKSFSDLTFTADGIVFNSISIVTVGSDKLLKFDGITAYNCSTNSWSSSGYKTLDFSVPPVGALKQWLANNGIFKF